MFGYNVMFDLLLVVIVFFIIVVIAIAIGNYIKVKMSPELTAKVKVINMRSSISNTTVSNTTTTYYSTFEFETGERKEFIISGKQYGLITIGDVGTLHYQHTKINGFDRED